MKTRSIIITAGGSGKRMKSNQPKQFLELKGKPILLHTLEQLYSFSPDSQFILTLPESHLAVWKEICNIHQCAIPHEVIAGGAERYHSVQQALNLCTGELIAVHDGVRPFVSIDAFERLFLTVRSYPAVIPAIEVNESLRFVNEDGNHAAPRKHFRIVQTPQVFWAEVLRKAYELPWTEEVTDDAGLVEQTGIAITLVEGNDENIKITTPKDLATAVHFLDTAF